MRVLLRRVKNRLEWLIAQPMQPRKQQKPYDLGLFDETRHFDRQKTYRLLSKIGNDREVVAQ